MTPYFADSFYYPALLSRDDEAHERALALTRELVAPMVTTAWVLTEVGDALAAPQHRPGFLELLEVIRTDPRVEIVPPTEDLFHRGVGLLGERLDKEWSVTDCISFVVMQERGIREALTGDHHFEQAGFRALLA